MQIKITGNTYQLILSVKFETDKSEARGVLRKGAAEWRLSHSPASTTEWIGRRSITHGEAIKRALVCLEREAAKLSLASRGR